MKKCVQSVAGSGPSPVVHGSRGWSRRVLAGTVAVLISACQFALHAQTTRTQTISLQAGWNAVFLEVQPANMVPSAVFSNTPVDIAAAYYLPGSGAQYLTDPGVSLFRQAGWGVWYAASRPDAFLKTLSAIYGQRAYLIHATADHVWQVTGEIMAPEVQWQANAFNLVGFSVKSQGGPTFSQFFSGSGAHRGQSVFRLVGGVWKRVIAPSAEVIRSGEAFWVFCNGASAYAGPMRAEMTSREGLLFGSAGDTLVLRNDADYPVTPTVEHVGGSDDTAPLALLVQVVGDASAITTTVPAVKPAGPWTQPMPAVERGSGVRLPFEVRRDGGKEFRDSALKITTDVGTEIWIPARTYRSNSQ